MQNLIAATVFFLLTHVLLSSTPLRGKLVGIVGAGPFMGLYSLIGTGAIVWMVIGYGAAPARPLWDLPGWLNYLPLAVMPVALILLVTGLATGNPTSIGQEKVLERKTPARGIIRVTRHPIQWAILLWSGAHLLVLGELGGLLFFGAFFLLALAGPYLIDRKRRAAMGAAWEAFAAVTSNVPFGAALAGRNRVVLKEIGWWKIVLGLALYVGIVSAHPFLFGAAPY